MVEPVAIPSSTTMTSRPDGSMGGRGGRIASPPFAKLRYRLQHFPLPMFLANAAEKPRAGLPESFPRFGDRPDRELGVCRSAKFRHEGNVELPVEFPGHHAPHDHAPAGDGQDERVHSPVGAQPLRETAAGFLAVLKNHPIL